MKWENKTENYNKTIFEEIVNSGNILLIEKITKAKRIMPDQNLNVFYQLRKWIQNRWSKKILKKEDFLKKKEEFSRFNYLLNLGKEMSKNSIGGLVQPDGELPYLVFGIPIISKDKIPDDFGIKTNTKDLIKIIRKRIIMHEYGHLFEFLKSVIVTGKELDSIEKENISKVKSIED